MKQHDRVSTASGGSRDMARDPQERMGAVQYPSAKEEIAKRIQQHTPSITANGKSYAMPSYGEVILTFHDGQLRYIERRTKEKVE